MTERNAGCGKCKWFLHRAYEVDRCTHEENSTTRYDWKHGKHTVYGDPLEINEHCRCQHWEAKDD